MLIMSVKWSGYGEKESTWEPYSELENNVMLQKYIEENKLNNQADQAKEREEVLISNPDKGKKNQVKEIQKGNSEILKELGTSNKSEDICK